MEHVTIGDVNELLFNKVIVFGNTPETRKHLLNGENDFSPNQKAKVIGVSIENNSNDPKELVYQLIVDFSEFEEFNNSIAEANYWDKDHQPTLKWCETDFYPKNKRTSFFIDAYKNLWPFTVQTVEEKNYVAIECVDVFGNVSHNAIVTLPELVQHFSGRSVVIKNLVADSEAKKLSLIERGLAHLES